MGFSKIEKVLCVAPLSAEWSAVSKKLADVAAGQQLQKVDKAKILFETAKNDQKVDVATGKVKAGLAKKKFVFRIEAGGKPYGKDEVTLVAKWTDKNQLAKAYAVVKSYVDLSVIERLNALSEDIVAVMKLDDAAQAIAEFNRVQQRVDKLTPECSQAAIKKQMARAAQEQGASLQELEAAHGDELKQIIKYAKQELEARKKLLDRADQYVTNLEAQADLDNRQAGQNEDPQYAQNLRQLADAYKNIVKDVRKQGPNAKQMTKLAAKVVKAAAEADDAQPLQNDLKEFERGKEAIELNLEDIMRDGREGDLGKRWEQLGITPEDNSKWVMVHWWNATRENRRILMELEAAERSIQKAMKKFA